MKKVILILIISLLFIPNVYAATNPYKKTSSYGTNCTWYAWKMAKEKANVTLPGWGNAKDWYKDASSDGYSVGKSAKAKSIVVWGSWTPYGHVGYVEKVSGDTMYVWDSTGPCIDEEDPEYIECMANGVSEESDRACKAAAPRVACKYSISNPDYPITGFIYLTNMPKTTVKATTTKEKETSYATTTTKEIKTTIETTTTGEKLTTTVTTSTIPITSKQDVTSRESKKEQKNNKKDNKFIIMVTSLSFILIMGLLIYIYILRKTK